MLNSTLLVAFGGISPEHEVSVITGIQTLLALKESYQNVLPLYITKEGIWKTGSFVSDLSNYKDLKKLKQEAVNCHIESSDLGIPELVIGEAKLFKKQERKTIQAIITCFHGSDGENGSFQGLCEKYNIPYSSSGVSASSNGMDKQIAKLLCQNSGIPVVESVDFTEKKWVEKKDDIITSIEELEYPVFVKPARLGSSIGVKKAQNKIDLMEAVETAFRYDHKILVEKAISPLIEINCSVLGDEESAQVSVCEQPKGSDELLSFKDKYQSNSGAQKGMASASRLIPAPISDELTKQIQTYSKQIFEILDCSGVVRLDFLVNSESNEIFFNEINTIPGSLSYYLWGHSGLSFNDLAKELVQIAIRKHQRKNGRIRSYETNLLDEKSSSGIKGLKGLKK